MNLFGKCISQKNLPFYVAEISCNHNGDLEQAKKLILAAKENKADAVKIQCYTPDEMTLNTSMLSGDFIVKEGPWKGQHLFDLYIKTQTNYEIIKELFNYADSIGMNIFASVFSEKGLEFLESIKCQVYKISSFELNDTPLIRKVAKTGKPVILSVPVSASIDHVERALAITTPINTALLHCVSAYPTLMHQTNLYRIEVLRSFYPVPVGFSDHTKGCDAAVAAVVLGARIIEKHMMLPDTESEDKEFSITPDMFGEMILACNEVMLSIQKSRENPELDSQQFKRSLYVIKDIKEGEAFTTDNIKSIRPSYGMDPDKLYQVITKRAKRDISRGEALKEDMLS